MIMRWMCTAVLAGLVVSGAWGQGSGAPNEADSKAAEALLPGATFDVATIKPSDPNAMASSSGAWPNLSKNYPLKNAICSAYGVLISRCLGGPAWLESDRYDIEAKPDDATAEQFLKLSWKQRAAVQHRMVQTLFADRIKLKAHFETREVTIFALVVAKGGLKMHEAQASDGYANGLKRDDGKAYGAGVFSMSNSMGVATVTAQGTSLANLVLNLPGITGHLVEDKTGLTGIYDFTLHYSPVDPPPPDSTEPSIYTALQEQLGLKLESVKGLGKVLVIDSVERPSEN
ncbi:MAG TPA: TIGR03435 family protein [Acidobacteriaceae bacterium]|nr:TIGR03435 family protein [Acidobacteriaceae bacterium]